MEQVPPGHPKYYDLMVNKISNKYHVEFKEDIVTLVMVQYTKKTQDIFMMTGRQRGKWLAQAFFT